MLCDLGDGDVSIVKREYTVAVTGGSLCDDRNYFADEEVGIIAAAPASGKIFDKWTSADGVTFADANSATTTFMMPAKAVTVTATYKDIPPATYAAVVTGGTGSGNYAEGATVTITAAAPASGKVFDKWTSADGVTFTDANSATTTFKMPAKAVTITATYKDEAKEDPQNDPQNDPQDDPENETHKHTMTYHERVAPSEESAGSIEYWECSGCKKLFTDADGKNEITADKIAIDKLPDARTVVETSAPVIQSGNINDKPVELDVKVSYVRAVTWTDSTITKEQLAALSDDGAIAQLEASGLKEALSKYNDAKVKLSDLFTVGCTVTGKDITDSDNKAFFKVTVKLNSKKAKKAGIKGDDKKALEAILDELNKQLAEKTYYFEIRPVRLDDKDVTVTIKSTFSKKKYVQKNEDGTIKKLKSVTVKYKVPGAKGKKKTVTKTIKKASAQRLFTITVTDDSKKKKATADIAVTPENKTYAGTKTGVTVKP